MKLNTNTTIARVFGLTVGKSGSIWAPWSVMSIFSSPWLHNRHVVMRWCASVKRCKQTSSAFCWFLFCLLLFFPPSSLSPLSHSPAGFSQMEVAQHSRPALHNLRMKEGGSASHYTRFEPRRWWGALVRRGTAVRTLLFFFLSRNSRMRVNPHQICVYSHANRRKWEKARVWVSPQFVNLKRPGVSSTGYHALIGCDFNLLI